MLDAGDRVRLIGSLRAFSGEPSREALLQMVRSDPVPEVRTAALVRRSRSSRGTGATGDCCARPGRSVGVGAPSRCGALRSRPS